MSARTHVLVFPYPAQRHMPPLLDLTHQLLLHGIVVTVLVTPKNLPALTPLLSANPSSPQNTTRCRERQGYWPPRQSRRYQRPHQPPRPQCRALTNLAVIIALTTIVD
ncbi:hypothetical protein ACFX11_021068 [Malus domestica]